MKIRVPSLLSTLVLVSISVFAPRVRAALYDVVNVSVLSNTFECSLVATQLDVTINGTNVHAMCYLDTSPGAYVPVPAGGIPIPQIKVKVGDKLICHFTNNLPVAIDSEGASVHWHGLELDNDSDGTGVTQDSILPGQNYVYQFNTFRPGSFWFHSHMIPGNTTFAGMYGVISIPNTNETALVTSGVLPDPTNTYTLAMSDIDFNPTNGVVSRQIKTHTETNWYTINDIVEKCHLYETGQPGGVGDACSWAAMPGKTVLVNGQAPTTNSPNQTPMYTVRAGQRVRLHLLNESIARDFRLQLQNNGAGATTNLYRIGGQGGLINNVRVEGGMQGSWDTKFSTGEIVLGSGLRADVEFYPTGASNSIITLVGNPLPGPFQLSGSTIAVNQASSTIPNIPSNYPIAFFKIIGTASPSDAIPAAGDTILTGAAAVQSLASLATNTLLALGDCNDPTIRLTGNPTPTNASPAFTQPGPSIDNFAGLLDGNMGNGDFTSVPVVSTARYAYVGDVLELCVSNATTPAHPFHLHGFSMQPLRVMNSSGNTLFNFGPEFLDTINVYGGQTVVFRVRLDDRAKICDLTPDSTPPNNGPQLKPCTSGPGGGAIGRWLYHCHIFAHAGQGMMGELDVRQKRFRIIVPRYILSTIYIKLHPGDPVEQVTLAGQCEWQAALDDTGHGVSTGRDGLDFVGTEMTAMSLTGQSSAGPVTMTLDSAQLSTGQIKELENLNAGMLDIPPFTRSGSASGFFDVFATISVGGQQYHLASPLHLTGNFSSLPPSSNDVLADGTGSSISLLDDNGRDSGIEVSRQQFNLNPTPTVVPDAPVCPSNMTVYASSSSGAVVNYDVPEFFGDCPFGHHLDMSPPSGSTFPIGTTVVNVVASDDCGLSNSCSFTVTVLDTRIYPTVDWFFPTNLFPPPGSEYRQPLIESSVHYIDDRYLLGLRDFQLHDFSTSASPPVIGDSPQEDTFTCSVDFELSTDGGQTFTSVSRFARGRYTLTAGVPLTFDAEIVQLDISDGTPDGGSIQLRESPTLQSKGQTTVRPVAGGYSISSFFDIFTEISLDGGQTWAAHSAPLPLHLEMRKLASTTTGLLTTGTPEPSQMFPPYTDLYYSSGGTNSSSTNSGGGSGKIKFNEFNIWRFIGGGPIPPGGTNLSITADVNMQASFDDGQTWNPIHQLSQIQLQATPVSSNANGTVTFDTEMLSLDLSSDGIPDVVLIRESPTRRSLGQFDSTPTSDGSYRIASFFDIFAEISVDGGQTWTPTDEPFHVSLAGLTPEQPFNSPLSPPPSARYAGPMSPSFTPTTFPYRFANGTVLSNLVLQNFDHSYAPPQPGDSPQIVTINCQTTGDISTDSGQTFQPFHAQTQIRESTRHPAKVEVPNFYDIDILDLSMSGGNLPSGVMFRESPTKASIGRTSIRSRTICCDGNQDWQFSSYLDIFAESSLDGGRTWSPSGDSLTLVLQSGACPTITFNQATLPPAIVSQVYNQSVTAAGGISSFTYTATGNLPPGLSIDSTGVISGTPTVPGSYEVELTATDHGGCYGSQRFTINVNSTCSDTTAPTVTVSKPMNNAVVTTATITATGTATDDVEGSQVLYRVNGRTWHAFSLNPARWITRCSWTGKIDLDPGSNTIEIIAVDHCGNNAPVITRKVFYASPSTMTLTTNGYGSVTGPANLVVGANQLNVGQTYKFSAVPSPNNLFSNIVLYQNDVPTTITTPKNVSFTMGSNTAITVNFVTNRFVANAGAYSGLYMPATGIIYSNSGPMNITLTKSGTFTGTLASKGQKSSFSGAFGLDGSLTKMTYTGPIDMTPPDLTLGFGTPGHGQITGSISDVNGNWQASITLNQAAFSSANPCPLGGSNYTFILPGAVGLANVPNGDGFATIKISPTGTAAFAGKYADGASLSMSAPLSADLKFPFYQALYKEAGSKPAIFDGSAIGWYTFDTDVACPPSDIIWSHGLVSGIPYPDGFTTTSSSRAWLYVRPITHLRVINVQDMGIVFQDGGLTSAIIVTNATYAGDPAVITIPTSDNPYKVKLSLAPTGLMTGSFVPDPTKPSIKFFGAVMQSSNAATGFFIGTDAAGLKLSGYTTAKDQLKASPRH